MFTKKAVITIAVLAVVSGLLTVGYLGNQSGMGRGVSLVSRDDRMLGGVMMDQSAPWKEAGVSYPGFVAETAPAQPMAGDALTVSNRVQEQFSSFSVVVRNVTDYLGRLEQSATTKGGIVLSSSQNTYQGKTMGSLTIKVPQDQFTGFNAEVTQEVAKVLNRSIQSWDSTGERESYEDKRTALQEQVGMLQLQLEEATTAAQRAAIQNNINRVNQQITELERMQEQYAERVQFATVTVTASDSESYLTGDSSNIMDQWGAAWQSLTGVARMLAFMAIWIIVYAVLWLPLVLLVKMLIKSLKK